MGAVVLEGVDEMATAVADFENTGDLATDLQTHLTGVIGILTPTKTSAAAGLRAESIHDEELAHDLRERIVWPRIDAFKKRMQQGQRDGQLSADADLDVALDLVFGPIYHRFAYHLGMPDQGQLRTLVAHALRALNSTPSTH